MFNIQFPLTGQFIRHDVIDGELWFHASDVCRVLSLTNSRDVVSRLEDDLKMKMTSEFPTPGQDPWFINEEALYTIVLRCNGALEPDTVSYKFRKWVVGIIKTIRKTGSYVAKEEDQEILKPFGIKIQKLIQRCDLEIEKVELGTGKLSKLLNDREQLQKLLDKDEPKKPPIDYKKFVAKEYQVILEKLRKNQDKNVRTTERGISVLSYFQTQGIKMVTVRTFLCELEESGLIKKEDGRFWSLV